jgi:hypothetical protein
MFLKAKFPIGSLTDFDCCTIIDQSALGCAPNMAVKKRNLE